MKKTGKTNFDLAGGYIFGGFIIGAIYWIIQAFIDSYIFGKSKFITGLFSPSSYEIWMRTLVMSLLIFTGAFVQSRISKKNRAEEKLHRENSFASSIIKYAAEGLCVGHQIPNHPYTRFTVWNDRMTEITGYTIDEINKLGWYQSLYPDPEIQAKMVEKLSQIRCGKDILDEEWGLTRKDGVERIIKVYTSKFNADDGAVHVLVLVNDITESKKVEESIRRERDLVAGLMDTSPVGILIFDDKGVITFANIRAEKIIGLAKDKIIGMSYNSPVMHIADFDGKRLPDNRLPFNIAKEADESVFNIRYAIQRPDESVAYLSVNACPIHNEAKELTGVIVSLDDITEKIKSDKALEKSEQEKATILESVSELVAYQDTNLRIIWANRAAAESVNMKQKDLIGRYCFQVWNNREDPCPGCPVIRTLENGEVSDGEVDSDDGRSWWIRGYPVRNDDNEITGVVEVTEDITERKKSESSLRQSEAKNRALLNAIPDMIFHMNHEGKFLGYEGSEQELYAPKEKFVGKNVTEVLPDYLVELTMKHIDLALRTSELQVYEYDLEMDGKDNRYEARLSVCGENEVIVIARNITDKVNQRVMVADTVEN